MEAYFKGKKFIVTGANAGIGETITNRLVGLGAHVFAVGRDPAKLPPASPNLTPVCADVGKWEAYETIKALGPVDGLVNNAGVAYIESFLDMTQEGWDNTLNINSRGIVRISQAVAKNMIDAKIKGSIVNVSSTISERAIPDHTSYCASKGAVNQVTRVMSIELGPYGIRTNNVNPTVVMTKMGAKAWSDPEKSDPILKRIPLGRFAETDDVANVTLFLLSDYATYVNGVSIPVDGGFLTG
ncbi:Short-chain dehydrogenase/reductase, conserved site,NAD(P)-binding domain,Short-chain [Cinara cedri]|uniref:Short-chain dehydrogenase/reductase, conserved site,NAD(P)-binding domain,Short-chain n=1 Tax=Cinara cedri TaxID=506608 RepID=A0A5E4NIG0_9HEMI|nr:Short-chain dehydrogenase/reductase, conserved site,NAD(P)-binding domain,Short-chain [Cinara cedri]